MMVRGPLNLMKLANAAKWSEIQKSSGWEFVLEMITSLSGQQN